MDAQKLSPDARGCLPGIPELKVYKEHMGHGFHRAGILLANATVRGYGGFSVQLPDCQDGTGTRASAGIHAYRPVHVMG